MAERRESLKLSVDEQVQRLTVAQSLIEEVQQSLNTTESECSACGTHRAENWDHLKASKELGSAITKLMRIRVKLSNGQ